MNLINFFKNHLSNIAYILKANGTFGIIFRYITLQVKENYAMRYDNTYKKYYVKQEKFREQIKTLTLDNDWFTPNIPSWSSVFDRIEGKDIFRNGLEIGSWQGLSAYFLLQEFPNLHMTCVDTWEGADEHKSHDHTTKEILETSEAAFDNNLSIYNERFKKYKGTSLSYFNSFPKQNCFDLIYIDGSHHSDDVVLDAMKGFEMLSINGIMIFDDYFWSYYSNPSENPAGAINAFLTLKKHQLEILSINYQLIIRKKSNSARYNG